MADCWGSILRTWTSFEPKFISSLPHLYIQLKSTVPAGTFLVERRHRLANE
jgi:hypothetical protein